MDLYSGLPYWIIKNPLYNYYNPLHADQITDVVIIGTGITGALVAHELCKNGIKCVMIDKRGIANGSSVASTALLQYEIDTPLYKLAEKVGEENAATAYHACLQSISDLENVFEEIGYNPDFNRLPSLFYASNHKGLRLIKKEYEIRKKHQLPVTYMNSEEVKRIYGIDVPGALFNEVSGEMDAYSAATHIISYHLKKKELKVYTYTQVNSCTDKTGYCEIETDKGYKIQSKFVIIAAGFEAGMFLPKKVMNLTSTYAIISQPLEKDILWYKKSLIWETQEPYLYIRTSGNRIIVGGEDEDFRDPILRDKLLRKKVAILEKKIKTLFPNIPFVTDMAWCGTFSSTEDGLPYIGNWEGEDKILYALGYGGNGITFSMIAAQMLTNKIRGIQDRREKVFGFTR